MSWLWAETAREMRENGVRRIAWHDNQTIAEIELEPTHPDTIPAPSLEPEIEAEQKPPGMCAVPGCRESAGFHFAPHLCRDHGMSQLGVKT